MKNWEKNEFFVNILIALFLFMLIFDEKVTSKNKFTKKKCIIFWDIKKNIFYNYLLDSIILQFLIILITLKGGIFWFFVINFLKKSKLEIFFPIHKKYLLSYRLKKNYYLNNI